jgi:hypothetical protein
MFDSVRSGLQILRVCEKARMPRLQDRAARPERLLQGGPHFNCRLRPMTAAISRAESPLPADRQSASIVLRDNKIGGTANSVDSQKLSDFAPHTGVVHHTINNACALSNYVATQPTPVVYKS